MEKPLSEENLFGKVEFYDQEETKEKNKYRERKIPDQADYSKRKNQMWQNNSADNQSKITKNV